MQGMFASTFDTRIGTPCEARSTNYTEGGTGPYSTYGEFRTFLGLTTFGFRSKGRRVISYSL